MLGTGAWARVLADAARSSQHLDVVACWGRNPDRARAFADELHVPLTDDLDRVLADQEIEAVIIAVPNDRHREFAERAARSGKHVFVEKPIASTLVDGLAMVDLEARYGVHIAVGHCARMLAGNRYARQAIAAGTLGRVSLIEARFANDRGLRLAPQDWRWRQSGAPGGPLSQIAIHQLDTLRALGGDLEYVSALSAKCSPLGAEVEDQWVLGIGFADGKLGAVTTSWTSAGEYSVQVAGDAGTLRYEVDQALWGQPSRIHEGATLSVRPRGGLDAREQRFAVAAGNMFSDELDAFAETVRTGAPLELSAENGCRALAAVDASLLSAHRGGAAVFLSEVFDAAMHGAGRVFR